MSDGPENTMKINTYIHCGLCVRECQVNEPQTKGHSPATYAQLEVGWTVRGFQVWCRRHDCNVMHVDFEGAQHKANTTRKA